MVKLKKRKVGDRIFFEDFSDNIKSALILDIEDREMDSDMYGRPAKKGSKVKYKLYKTGAYTAIEDYNCLSENDPRVIEYRNGREFITINFVDELRQWLDAHGAHKGDQDVAEILYNLSLEYE